MTSYGDDEGFEEWLSAQGLTLPPDAPSADVLRQLGSAYVDSAYEYRLQCSRRAGGFEQPLAWPRSGHKINGQTVPSDLIPQAWVYASYRAAWLNATTPGWSTDQVTPGRITKREKVDVIERTFMTAEEAGGGSDSAPGFPSDAAINGMILPWLCSAGRNPNSLFRVV